MAAGSAATAVKGATASGAVWMSETRLASKRWFFFCSCSASNSASVCGIGDWPSVVSRPASRAVSDDDGAASVRSCVSSAAVRPTGRASSLGGAGTEVAVAGVAVTVGTGFGSAAAAAGVDEAALRSVPDILELPRLINLYFVSAGLLMEVGD
jgi:hypothetical protein